MTMNAVRTALIGCGKVGQIHAAALYALPESEFVAVCDSDAGPGRGFRGAVRRAPLHRRCRPCSSECGVQAVFIGTPHPLHAEPAIEAAEAGVHVLVEKPMAASLADCDAMLAAAQRTGVKLGVVSQRRWYEPVRRMKEAIDAGKIGRPVLGASRCIAGATRRTISPIPGAAGGTPRGAASWSTSRRTCSTCSCG